MQWRSESSLVVINSDMRVTLLSTVWLISRMPFLNCVTWSCCWRISILLMLMCLTCYWFIFISLYIILFSGGNPHEVSEHWMTLVLHIVPLLCHDTLSLKHLLLPHFALFLLDKLHIHSYITLLHSKLMWQLLLLVWYVSLLYNVMLCEVNWIFSFRSLRTNI